MNTSTDNTNVMSHHPDKCRNCGRAWDDCPNPHAMPVHKGAGNLFEMTPERYWYCTEDDWHRARDQFYYLRKQEFGQNLIETAEQVHRATGLPTDHPHTIDEVARLCGVSVPAARSALVKHEPLTSKWRNIREVKAQEYSDEDLWLIDGVIPRGTVTVFAGKSKAGKSRLAMEAARALVMGDPFLGEYDVIAEGTPVVFMCGDDSDAALGALFKSFAEQFGIGENVSLITNPDVDLLGPAPLGELYTVLRAHKGNGGTAPLVVFDSLYNYTPSMDDNDRAQSKTVMGLLGDLAGSGLAAGVLVVDHSAKVGSAGQGADAVIGSQAKGGMARSGINVEAIGEAERDGREVLVTRLVRWGNSGRGWNVKYAHHAPSFTWTKVDEADDLADRAAVLLAAAEDRTMPLKELGAALGHQRTNEASNPVRKAVEGDARFVLGQVAARQPWTVTLVDEGAPGIA